MKEQEKTPEKIHNDTEINILPDKEFKALVIKMLTELRKRTDVHSECVNKEGNRKYRKGKIINEEEFNS